MINLILASTFDGGIGYKGRLPWHYKNDLKVFKALTLGCGIIMGRNTWDSLPKKPLPGRANIILSRSQRLLSNENGVFEDTFVINNFIETLEYLQEHSRNETWVIGGASLYKQFAHMCSYVQHTLVRKNYECDTFFNPTKEMDLELVSEIDAGADSDIVFRLYRNRGTIFKKNQKFEERTAKLIRDTLGIS